MGVTEGLSLGLQSFPPTSLRPSLAHTAILLMQPSAKSLFAVCLSTVFLLSPGKLWGHRELHLHVGLIISPFCFFL